MTRPTLLVIEDGKEYTERFRRFLGRDIAFVRATCLSEARAALADAPLGLLLDLDFRRTPRAALVDEEGRENLSLPEAALATVSEQQGILILRALRQGGCALPAILFADLHADQAVFLGRSLAPLRIIPSDESLPNIAQALRALAGG